MYQDCLNGGVPGTTGPGGALLTRACRLAEPVAGSTYLTLACTLAAGRGVCAHGAWGACFGLELATLAWPTSRAGIEACFTSGARHNSCYYDYTAARWTQNRDGRLARPAGEARLADAPPLGIGRLCGNTVASRCASASLPVVHRAFGRRETEKPCLPGRHIRLHPVARGLP
eukprot:5680710-Prymnesium_polylepis.1